MTIPNIPSTAIAVDGENDAGEGVMINSVGGCYKNVEGKVVFGPYTFTFISTTQDKKGKKKQKTIQTMPYWHVLIKSPSGDQYISFSKEELTFV
jgi:hypothetical protein